MIWELMEEQFLLPQVVSYLNVTMGNVLVTSCVFMTNKCINGNGGAFFIASGYKEHGNIDLENVPITNCSFNNNYGLYGGGAVSIGPCFKTSASASLRSVLITHHCLHFH